MSTTLRLYLAVLLLLMSYAVDGECQTFTIDSGVTLNSGPLSQGCSWADVDADGLPDLYASTAVFSAPAANPVFLNDGAGGLAQSFTSPRPPT